ncbi:universal stress protein [Sulfurovum sp. ST-21]|uniref:Universal stress protein n=1 Tax=Sulfurovum indicum TaxID=2779528 RepID=A0A7M1S5K7_9BACT|nr:universal stress protein [Sulfurovum indicum]QOR62703.1 universal stress protein [Sulfurovum indicum]
MKKVKRILVGIDIFEKPDSVLKRALMVAEENKAALFVVHAVQTPLFSIPSYFGGKEVNIDTKGITKKIEKKIHSLNKNRQISYAVLVKEGDPGDIILYESKLIHADMIVIGASRKNKKKYLGATAEKVAHQSHLPVLIVKNSVKRPYQNIVAPTDLQTQSKQSILFAKSIFPSAKIKVVNSSEVIYVDGPYTVVGSDFEAYNRKARISAEKDLKNFIKDLSLKKGEVIDGKGSSKEVLLEYINKKSYDLVVVGSRGTSGFKALLGSMASSILRETSTDVLVYVP